MTCPAYISCYRIIASNKCHFEHTVVFKRSSQNETLRIMNLLHDSQWGGGDRSGTVGMRSPFMLLK